jgi:UDP-N-acetylmuramate-alanine ligase
VRDRSIVTEHVARLVRPGDVVFTLGAGDITRVGRELLTRLETKAAEERRGS